VTVNDQNSLPGNEVQANKHQNGQPTGLQASKEQIDLAVVRCCGSFYGFELKWVREIRSFNGATPMYGLPPYWVGITALRGQLYAALDLQKFLSPKQDSDVDHKQILHTAVNDILVGLLVEEIPAVRQVGVQALTRDGGSQPHYVLGTTPDQIIVLDLQRLFADPLLMGLARRTDDLET
jgi:chemotaxis signal transduction protein